MILSDFLSRQKHEDSNPHDTIPISFNMHNILHERYYNLGLTDTYLVQTQSQTKSSGIILPEVHGVTKILDTSTLPEKQKTRIDLEFEENSPYQGGIISKTYQRPDNSFFQELKELENLVNAGRLVQKFLLKLADIYKTLKIIQ